MLAANGKITIRQLQILIILSALGTGVIILPRRVAEFAGQDGWIIVVGLVLLAVFIGVLISAAVSAATKTKPNAGFIEFTGFLLTKPVAYICGTLLWLKLVFSAGLELRVFLNITQSIMLQQTPLAVVSFAMLCVCAYAAAKGMETRARVAEILIAVMAIPFIFLVGLAFFDTDFSNLQPVMVTPGGDLLRGVVRLGFIFTGLECLLLVSPFIGNGRKQFGRHVASALGFAGGIILLITILTIAKFGRGVTDQPWPVLRMMDMLNIPGSFVERQEALMFSFWIITAFAIGNTMLFFGGLLVKDMFRPRTKYLGVIVTAAAVFAVSVFPWRVDVYRVLDFMYLTVGMFFMVVLPILLLIAAKIRIRTKHVAGAAALVAVLLSFTGCWDRVEVEDRAFVVAIGIDEEDGEYEVSLSVPLLKKEGQEDDEAPHIKTATGKTISEAMKNLDAKTDKTLYYGHAKLLVLGKDLLEDADMVSSTIAALEHKDEIDLRINVLATNGSAKDILETKPPGEVLPGLFVAELYRDKNKLGGVSFAMDLERLSSSYKDGVIIPKIKKTDNEETPLKLSGAVVLKESINIGSFSTKNLRGYLWCRNHGNKNAVLTLEIGDNFVPVKIEKHDTKVNFANMLPPHHPGFDKPAPAPELTAVINVKISAKEVEPLPHGITRDMLHEELEDKIKTEILQTANKLQNKFAVDGYDWLEHLRKKNYELYKLHSDSWDKVFPTIKVVPLVDIIL